jgi:hypothetical protein
LWDDFTATRMEYLTALGPPIVDCVGRDDTRYAVFHGCYDWHSAVHGHFALLALARVTEDDTWADTAQLGLTAEGLAAELDSLPRNELPYGYAWLLRLARERHETGDEDLDTLASACAERLAEWLDSLGPNETKRAVQANDYGNASWAALNLWEWGALTGDEAAMATAEDFARGPLIDTSCPLAEEGENEENFFPACLMRAHALLRILPASETAAWVAAEVPAEPDISPVTNITSAHLSGLNFSRPWGLWTLWLATGNPLWRDAAREHVEWHMAHPEYWAENYTNYSHWVPQFGVYAMVTMIDDGG